MLTTHTRGHRPVQASHQERANLSCDHARSRQARRIDWTHLIRQTAGFAAPLTLFSVPARVQTQVLHHVKESGGIRRPADIAPLMSRAGRVIPADLVEF